MKNPCVVPLDDSMEGHKAVLIINKKPIYGTIQNVKSIPSYQKEDESQFGKVFATMLTKDGISHRFSAGEKLAKGEFRLISDDVFQQWASAKDFSITNLLKKEQMLEPEMKNIPVKPNSPSVIQLGEQFMPQSPSVEISNRPTKSKIVRQSEKEPVVGELVLDKSLEGKKALAFVDGKPTFGTVTLINPAGIEIFIQMLTNNEKTIKFEATAKIARDDFRIITDDVYQKWTEASEEVALRSLERILNRKTMKKTKVEPIFIPSASNQQQSASSQTSLPGMSSADLLATYDDGCYNLDINKVNTDVSEINVGDIVQTKVLDGKYKGSFFARAEVLNIEKDGMDLRILSPDKWQVASTACRVPKDCIRTLPKSQLESYVVPLELDVDHSIMFAQCNKAMKIKNLKSTIFKLRGIEQSLLNIVTKSDRPLSDESEIPNDVLLCKVHQLKEVESISRRLTEIL